MASSPGTWKRSWPVSVNARHVPGLWKMSFARSSTLASWLAAFFVSIAVTDAWAGWFRIHAKSDVSVVPAAAGIRRDIKPDAATLATILQ
jgi:hypothetical protein